MPSELFASQQISRHHLAAAIATIAVSAFILWMMGQVLICKCGYVKFWEGAVLSAGNSQHVMDWYTFSHIIHGFLFFCALWVLGRKWSVGLRLVAAVVIESGWEVFENTSFIIDRYREATISLDYYGDSVLNSVSDILAMVFGFCLAWRLPVWLTIGLALAMEIIVGTIIRDNLTLNIIMLVWPLEFIKQWQAGA